MKHSESDRKKIFENKQRVRTEILGLRKNLSSLDVEKASRGVSQRSQEFLPLKGLSLELFYFPVRGELSLLFRVQALLKVGKKALFPKVSPQKGERKMNFVPVTNLETDFTVGKFGIPEPLGEIYQEIPDSTLIWVPGVAFSLGGERIGHGMGYYDFFLRLHPNLLKIGVAYDFQIYPKLPTESFDVSMDLIITPSRLIETSKRGSDFVRKLK